jgi:hypothetical protein
VVEARAIDLYTRAFERMRFKSRLPTRLAAEMAATLASGIYKEIFAQIDPIKLGEMDRANRVGYEYGMRLARRGKNAKKDALLKLVAEYPAHEFVIDDTEARTLFENVRAPSELEAKLDALVAFKKPLDRDKALTFFLDVDPEPQDETQKPNGTDGEVEAGRAAESRPDGQNP